jgi:anti-sigma regulatory factor (Ser/Thr protein kinase)
MSAGEALSASYPAVPEAVPIARGALTAVATGAGATGEQLEEIRLAVSEALTNAVLHAYGDDETGSFHVTAAIAGGDLWVLIDDDGHGLHAGKESPGLGIGLALISGLSDDFSIVSRASGGTEVQMRFDLRGAASGARVITPEGRAAQRSPWPGLASLR